MTASTTTTTRINRNRAFVMLLVWAFAMVSGLANACLLEESGSHARAGITAQTSHNDVRHGSLARQSQPEAGPDQDDDAHTSRQPCLKVCDDSSRSLPKQYPSSQIDPGPPIVVAVLWTAFAPIHLLQYQPTNAQRVTSGLPLRVVIPDSPFNGQQWVF